MARNRVMCEINLASKKVMRILKNGEALFLPPERTAEWPVIEAEREIKKQLLEIQDHTCPLCGKIIDMSGHLHEKLFRSKGGTPGLENSIVLCTDCHIGRNGEHKDRWPKWIK